MLDNCFRFAPRDSIPGLIAKICKYLKDHPGWSEEELEYQIKKFISATGVESFNGRTGTVTLDKNDVNNLKIASAYFAEVDESIDSLDLVSLYNQGVRFVFTDFNSVTSGYNLAFVLDYFSGSGEVAHYPMSTGSGGGGNIVSVNGKTGVVQLSLADIVGTSSVQVKICTAEEFTGTTTTAWNAYYNEGYRIVGVVNSTATAIDHIYLLKQDENNHTPIGLSTGASDAYTPTNPPPYPVTSVNGKTGYVTGLYDQNNPPPYPVSNVNGKTGSVGLKVVDVSNGNSSDENAYIFIDESVDYPDIVSPDSSKLDGKTLAEIMLEIYPVGAVYISTNSTSPESLFGGTWEQIHGRFLLASGSPDANTDTRFGSITGGWVAGSGSTGGQDYHTLTVEEMPSHTHESQYVKGELGYAAAGMMGSTEANWWSVDYIRATGGGQKHNNMPPYLAVNMWKRVR